MLPFLISIVTISTIFLLKKFFKNFSFFKVLTIFAYYVTIGNAVLKVSIKFHYFIQS